MGRSLSSQGRKIILEKTFEQLITIFAARHAAGYALALATQHSSACQKLVIASPTWRGPFAVMGIPIPLRTGVKELVRTPLIGQALYGLNTQSSFLKWMYHHRVFVDELRLTPEYIEHGGDR